MEQLVGKRLFKRSSVGVSLTPAGQALPTYVRPGMTQIEQALNLFDPKSRFLVSKAVTFRFKPVLRNEAHRRAVARRYGTLPPSITGTQARNTPYAPGYRRSPSDPTLGPTPDNFAVPYRPFGCVRNSSITSGGAFT